MPTKRKSNRRKSHDPTRFLKLLAPHLISELRPPSEIKKFTKNTAIVGAYVEAAVRELVRRHVAPLRVASGAIIDQSNVPADPRLPQVHTIIWAPSPAPADFQVGEFALVPRGSAFGILEIKSSAYDLAKLDRRLSATFIRKLTADASVAEKQQMCHAVAGLGVVCLLMKNQSRAGLARMKNRSRVVGPFEERKKGKIVPRALDIYQLVNFLHTCDCEPIYTKERWESILSCSSNDCHRLFLQRQHA